MLEMPEAYTLARQMDETLSGKIFQSYAQGALRHKFLWLNRPAEESSAILAGKSITGASSYGRSIYLRIGAEHLLWFGEIGGRLLYHPAAGPLPSNITCAGISAMAPRLSFALQMWGFVRLLDQTAVRRAPA